MSRKSGKARRSETRAALLTVPAPTATPLNGKLQRMERDRPSRRSRGARPLVYASAIGVLMGTVMIALSLLSVNASTEAPVPDTADPAQSERRAMGSPDAPVVITEWMDFQCPACRAFTLGREPDLQRLYVDTGKVRFVSRDFAFLGPESFLAAEAAHAAADQGRYWAFRSLLYQRQRGENQGGFSVENLKRHAFELGLDQKAFNDALDRRVHRAAVLAERKEGEALGVDATPTLFINGRKVEGVPTMEALGKLIEEELAKTE